MSIPQRTNSGWKIGAGVGLALGVLSAIGFASILTMLALLLLDIVIPSVIIGLQMVFYASVASAAGAGAYIGGKLAKNVKDSWLSIGVGVGLGALAGLTSIVGTVMTLGSILGATQGAGGLLFVAMEALGVVAATTAIGSLIGGIIAKAFNRNEVNEQPSSKKPQENQQLTESNATSTPHLSPKLRSSLEASQLESVQSRPVLDSETQHSSHHFKLLDGLRTSMKESGRAGLEAVNDTLSTDSPVTQDEQYSLKG